MNHGTAKPSAPRASSPPRTSTSETLSLLEHRIRENAPRYFPELERRSVSVRSRRLPVGSNQIYLVELAAEGTAIPTQRVVVKIAPKPSRIEFDHFTLLYKNRTEATRALLVPRPLDFFADINALLTEHVGGEPLSHLVWRHLHVLAGRRRREALASWLCLSGAWLANYHRLTRAPDAPPFDDRWLAKTTAALHDLEEAGFPKPVIGLARRTLARLHDTRAGFTAPHAHRHGDFGLRNVHAGDGWVCVFDLNDNRVNCVYEDLSYFLVTLETMNRWPWHPLFDRRAAIAMKADFLAGYFGAPHRWSPLLLESHVLEHLLLRCARQRRAIAARSRALLGLFDAFQTKRTYPRRVLAQCNRVESHLPGP